MEVLQLSIIVERSRLPFSELEAFRESNSSSVALPLNSTCKVTCSLVCNFLENCGVFRFWRMYPALGCLLPQSFVVPIGDVGQLLTNLCGGLQVIGNHRLTDGTAQRDLALRQPQILQPFVRQPISSTFSGDQSAVGLPSAVHGDSRIQRFRRWRSPFRELPKSDRFPVGTVIAITSES